LHDPIAQIALKDGESEEGCGLGGDSNVEETNNSPRRENGRPNRTQ